MRRSLLLEVLVAVLPAAFWPAAGLGQGTSEAKPAATRTSGTSDARSRKVAQVATRLLQACQLFPFDIRKAAPLLGGRLGREEKQTEFRSRWLLSGTGLFRNGEAYIWPQGKAVVLTPVKSLELTVQDLEPWLLDLPYHLEFSEGHFDEDSAGTRILTIAHEFRVNAGVLRLEVAGPEPLEPPDQRLRAIEQGYATRNGTSTVRNPIAKIVIIDDVKGAQAWLEPLSLRQIRARKKQSPGAPSQAPDGAQ